MTHVALDTLAYIRVSTEQQAGDDKTSLPGQRRAIVDRARQLGRVIPDSGFFVDPGASGATAEGRPAFMALLGYCESHTRPRSNTGLILVLNDSRFGRFDDPEEAMHWRFVLKRVGWIVRFVEGDDMPDGTARSVMRLVGSAQASEYRANLRRTAKNTSVNIATQGRWRCEAPMGYRRLATRTDGTQRVLDLGQRKADDEIVRLTLGPESEQAIVRWMFEAYASGDHSLTTLALALQLKFPGRTWQTATVRAVLLNPTYVGDIVHGRRPMDEGGTQRTERDVSQWLTVPDTHPAIISRELFALVGRRLAAHKRLTRPITSPYVLTGLLTCSCGQCYRGGGGQQGPESDPGRWLFYRCGGAERTIATCRPPLVTLNKRWVEGLVIARVSTLVTAPETAAAIRAEIATYLERGVNDAPSRRASLTADRDRTLAQRARIVAAIAAGTIESEEAARTMSELRATLASLEAEITRIAADRTARASVAHQMDVLLDRAAEFPTVARNASPQALRALLAPWIHSLLVNKDARTLTMTYHRFPILDTMRLQHSPGQDRQDHNYSSPLPPIVETVPIPGKGKFLARGAQ